MKRLLLLGGGRMLMPLVFAAAANHAPGITSRRDTATTQHRDVSFSAHRKLQPGSDNGHTRELALAHLQYGGFAFAQPERLVAHFFTV